MVGKVQQKNRDRKNTAKKVWQKNHGRKIAVEKVREKNHGSRITTAKPWKQSASTKKKVWFSYL
jgi:hypothetical protein